MTKIKKIVDSYSEEIVKIVNNLDKIEQFKKCFGDNKAIGKSQLSNLIKVVKNANSIEEVKLFLAYQAAKDNKKWGKRIKTFSATEIPVAEVVLEAINEVLNLIDMEECEKLGITKENEIIELKLKLSEKFFGYLYWKGNIYAAEEEKYV